MVSRLMWTSAGLSPPSRVNHLLRRHPVCQSPWSRCTRNTRFKVSNRGYLCPNSATPKHAPERMLPAPKRFVDAGEAPTSLSPVYSSLLGESLGFSLKIQSNDLFQDSNLAGRGDGVRLHHPASPPACQTMVLSEELPDVVSTSFTNKNPARPITSLHRLHRIACLPTSQPLQICYSSATAVAVGKGFW